MEIYHKFTYKFSEFCDFEFVNFHLEFGQISLEFVKFFSVILQKFGKL